MRVRSLIPHASLACGLLFPLVPPATASLQVSVVGPVPSARAGAVRATLLSLAPHLRADLGLAPPPIRVVVYASHHTFAAAMWRLERMRPQGEEDNTSGVVRGTLLVGPIDGAYVRHNLAHVYTEWTMDRLTGNTSDRLPPNPWLYDGLAEVEAYRYERGTLPCRAAGPPPFDVATITTPAAWLRLRAGPLGSMMYCLAYLRARALVHAIGWRRTTAWLRLHGWKDVAPLVRMVDPHRGRSASPSRRVSRRSGRVTGQADPSDRHTSPGKHREADQEAARWDSGSAGRAPRFRCRDLDDDR